MRPDIAPVLGDWAAATCSQGDTRGSTSCGWAPEVVVVPGSAPDDTVFTLYCTARRTGTGRQRIGVPTAPTKQGPFVPAGTEPLIRPKQVAVDPHDFTDDDGRYILRKVDGNSVGQPTAIYLQRLSADGLSLPGSPVELFRADQA